MRGWFLFSALVLLGGCADEPPTIRLFINTLAAVPDELNGFEVEIAASAPDRRVCKAVTGLVYVVSEAELPALVSLEKGEIFTENVWYGIRGLRNANHVTEPRIGGVAWPVSGVRDVEITLDRDCFYDRIDERSLEGEHCRGGRIEPTEVPPEFDDRENVDEDILCWSPE